MADARALDVKTIARMLNARAGELAPYLLPNGRRSGDRRHWETNNLGDTPRAEGSYSLKVDLQGANIGQWRDFATGEHGDMIDLVRLRQFGGDKAAAVAWAKSELGLDSLDPDRVAKVRYQAEQRAIAADEDAAIAAEAKKRGARALWLAGGQLAGTPAARYLEGRALIAPADGWPGSLRFHPEVFNRDARCKLPAMVATMVTPLGAQVATHRTWLGRDPRTRQWVKADGADLGVPQREAKKVLGKCRGAFVPIAKGASGHSMGTLAQPETVYVTEGIEDALTVAQTRPALRVIAAYSVDNIGAIEFPPMIDRIVICADRDVARTDGKRDAIDALEAAIARQQARGKAVQLVYPPEGFKDFNAWLQADQPRAAA